MLNWLILITSMKTGSDENRSRSECHSALACAAMSPGVLAGQQPITSLTRTYIGARGIGAEGVGATCLL
jgi:hypothetical protein